MAFDAKRLVPLDWGILGAGAVAFISLFLPWWGVSIGVYSASVSGWNTSYGWLGRLLLVAAGVWFLLYKSEVSLPKLPMTVLAVTVGASTLGLLIVIIRWITLPSGGALGHTFNYGARAGIWVAALAGAVQVACAVILFRQSGEQLPWKTTAAPPEAPSPL